MWKCEACSLGILWSQSSWRVWDSMVENICSLEWKSEGVTDDQSRDGEADEGEEDEEDWQSEGVFLLSVSDAGEAAVVDSWTSSQEPKANDHVQDCPWSRGSADLIPDLTGPTH